MAIKVSLMMNRKAFKPASLFDTMQGIRTLAFIGRLWLSK